VAFGGQEFGNTSATANRGEGWVWTDGTPAPYPVGGPLVGYMNWNGGEPNNAGTGENYAEMNGGWNDLPAANRAAVFEFTSLPNYVVLSNTYPSIPTVLNSIRGNNISSNGAIGIDLGNDGPTANDLGDPDTGPNGLLNYPVLTSVKVGASTTVTGTYNGLANSNLNVDIYANAAGNGNQRYLGTVAITTDASGNASFSTSTLPGTTAGETVTATATDSTGSTSEFFAAPPTATIAVNNGAAQRSMVTSVTVTFSEPVNFVSTPAAAFTLQRLSTSSNPTPTGAVTLAVSPAAGPANTYTITFNDPTFAPGLAKSLIDGKYTLTLNANQIKSAATGQFLDGNGDFTTGDNQSLNFHRLFGDSDGDTDVDNSDFVAFRSAFGAGPSPVFDSDGDGDVDNADFVAFRARFGQVP